jgi:hypothetical protein
MSESDARIQDILEEPLLLDGNPPEHQPKFNPTPLQLAKLVLRAAIMGPIRGAYQGASALKLLFAAISLLFGLFIPFVHSALWSAIGLYAVVETIKFGRKEWEEQKALFTAKQALAARQATYKNIISSEDNHPSQPDRKEEHHALTVADRVYTYVELVVRSFKDSAKLFMTTLFLSGISYKAGLLATHPILCGFAIGFAALFSIAAFFEEYRSNQRKKTGNDYKAQKKMLTVQVRDSLETSVKEKRILDNPNSPLAVNARYKKLQEHKQDEQYQNPTFTRKHISKARLLLHGFCGFINGAYLCATVFMLTSVFFHAFGFHPIALLVSAIISGGLHAAHSTKKEWRCQQQEFLAENKYRFYRTQYETLQQSCSPAAIAQSAAATTPRPEEKSTLTIVADIIASPFSRIRHLGRAFKNATKLSLAAFLVAGASVVGLGLPAIIPVSIFVGFFCCVSIVQFNTDSNAKKRIKQWKTETKNIKNKIYLLKKAELDIRAEASQPIAIAPPNPCRELPVIAPPPTPVPIQLTHSTHTAEPEEFNKHTAIIQSYPQALLSIVDRVVKTAQQDIQKMIHHVFSSPLATRSKIQEKIQEKIQNVSPSTETLRHV